VDGDSSHERFRLTVDDPLAGLARWVAEGRVDAAARERSRQRWLERQAGEEASVAGVLLDLAEQARPVMVRTAAGRTARGPIIALGADFAIVREVPRGDVVIPLGAIATVRSPPGAGAPVGDRPLELAVMLAEALVELSADRPLVLIAAAGEEIRGELSSAGTDVVTVTTASTHRDVVHVAVGAIDNLVLLGR
jgi:hypothetical protein